MTVHPRTAIRHAVMERLAADSDGPFRSVVRSRVHNFQPAELPGLAVYTLTETSSRDSVAPKLRREVVLFVDIHLQAGADLDDQADVLALEVETLLAASSKLGGLCLESRLDKTTIGLNGEGERRTGLCRLEYLYVYRTLPGGTPA